MDNGREEEEQQQGQQDEKRPSDGFHGYHRVDVAASESTTGGSDCLCEKQMPL